MSICIRGPIIQSAIALPLVCYDGEAMMMKVSCARSDRHVYSANRTSPGDEVAGRFMRKMLAIFIVDIAVGLWGTRQAAAISIADFDKMTPALQSAILSYSIDTEIARNGIANLNRPKCLNDALRNEAHDSQNIPFLFQKRLVDHAGDPNDSVEYEISDTMDVFCSSGKSMPDDHQALTYTADRNHVAGFFEAVPDAYDKLTIVNAVLQVQYWVEANNNQKDYAQCISSNMISADLSGPHPPGFDFIENELIRQQDSPDARFEETLINGIVKFCGAEPAVP